MRSRRSLKSVGLGLVDVLGSLSEVVLAGLLMLASTLLVMAFQFFAPYLLVVALAGVALLLYYLLQLMLQHLLVVLFACFSWSH